MVITLSSLINLFLFSNIMIIVLLYVLKRTELVLKIGLDFILLYMLITILRLFLPIELPTQHNITIKKIWPNIYMFIKKTRATFAGIELSLFSIFLIISITGTFLITLKLFYSYFLLRKSIKKLTPITNPIIYEILDQIKKENGQNIEFSVVQNNEIASPFVFGFFKRYIVLPRADFSVTYWNYILKHETAHFYHKDLWIRLACELLKALYWWNPFIYILEKGVTKVQEHIADGMVTCYLNKLQKFEYMQCLIGIAKNQTCKQKLVIAFNDNKEVANRIRLMQKTLENFKHTKKKAISIHLFRILLITFTLFLPNVLIFEPYGISEKHAEESFEISSENSYIIKSDDETYYLYVNDNFIGPITYLIDTIPVYNVRGENK